MADVTFKRGLLADLPQTYREGTIYVTTDERALYLDVDQATRIRLGDFQEFSTLAALQAHANPSNTALYYVTELNCLAKWNGTAYVQINLDTGATSVEVVGSGNAITGITYNPATRKLTATKGATYTTPSDVDTKIAEKVGAIDGTIQDYIDSKTGGGSENLSSLIGELPEDAQSENLVDYIAESIAALGIGNYAKAADLTSAVSRIAANEAALNTLNGSGEGSITKQIADKLAAIVADAPEDFDTLKEISDWITEHADSAAAMNSQITDNKTAVTNLKALIGELPANASADNVVDYIAEAISALSIGEYAKAADLTNVIARVNTLESNSHTHTNKDILDSITAERVAAWDSNSTDAKLSWGTF